MKARHLFVVATALFAGVTATVPAFAQAAAPTRVDKVEYVGPDRGLLRSGAWTLGLGYVPALFVAIESPRPADRYLFVPVAGPWLDIAHRDCDNCRNEGLNQFLIAADGVVQGVGALEIVGSFLFLERSVTTRSSRKARANTALNLRFKPTRVPGGYGLTAIGNF
jgi:hypothetical protein